MCIIALAKNVHPEYPLILIGNRDEFYMRPTMEAHWWNNDILAGKDLEAHGTWLGVSRNGKLATLTNYRDILGIRSDVKSRGALPVDFLVGTWTQQEYHFHISQQAQDYNGFNLLTWENGDMFHFSNYEHQINRVNDGIHVLSNALLDTPWFKSQLLREKFSNCLHQKIAIDCLLEILNDATQSPEHLLPQTGLPYEREKAISSIYIESADYGTCCSTVVLINHKNEVTFVEKIYPVGNREATLNHFEFIIES